MAINIIAILLSPIIAVLVTSYLQSYKEKRNQKLFIFNTLISTRHSPINNEIVRALNMNDVVFCNDKNVRRLWREYYDILNTPGFNNTTAKTKNLELITEMAKVIGYGKEISAIDVDRVYYPVGLGEYNRRSEEISNELLRVLRASGGLQVTTKND